MSEPETRRRFPSGLVLTVAALGGLLLVILRTGMVREPAAPWPGVAAAVLAAAATFVAVRWLYNYFWGVVAALLLTLHPLFAHATETTPQNVFAEALQLTTLALVVWVWRLLFSDRFDWLAWLLLLVGLTVTLDAACLTEPMAAQVVLLLAGPGLLVGALLTLLRRYWAKAAPYPSGWNVTVGVLAAVLVPVMSLAMVPPLVGWLKSSSAADLCLLREEVTSLELLQSAFGDGTDSRLTGFSAADLEQWAWPLPWLMLGLVVWGLWRSVRRGRKQWLQKRPSLAWLLPLYTLATVAAVILHPEDTRAVSLLPLASFSVLLAVSCVADLFRGAAESLVLAPPQETHEGAAE